MNKYKFYLRLVLLSIMLCPVTLFADTVNVPVEGEAIAPIELLSIQPLNFGTFVRPTSGSSTISIDAASGVRTLDSGNATLSGGSPDHGTVEITAAAGETIIIDATTPTGEPTGHTVQNLEGYYDGSQYALNGVASVDVVPTGGVENLQIGGELVVTSTATIGIVNAGAVTYTLSVVYQ